jgi:hypothetical protein
MNAPSTEPKTPERGEYWLDNGVLKVYESPGSGWKVVQPGFDLYEELLLLLYKAKATEEYWNPHNLVKIQEALEENRDFELPEDLADWIKGMWSR